MYIPNPVDISNISLTPELEKIAEQLSKNTHEIWSSGKIADGWKFGETTNCDLKEHASLIPYEQLSESEKDYDRRTTIGTIKTLLALGYTITKIDDNGV